MRRFPLIAALIMVAAGCAPDTAAVDVAAGPDPLVAAEQPFVPPEAALSVCSRLDGPFCVFDVDGFDDPTVIDNRWLPLVPGTRLVFEGTTDEGELLDHQVIITVTDLVKVINGIETVVTWDLDFSDGELVEAELAFFAQDNEGNVWRMGEHPEEYEDGELVDAPTWIAGVNGAVAGVSMLADPVVGSLSYSQGWGPEVEFIDRGRVLDVGEPFCIELECFDSVLVVSEFNVEEAGASQLKYYARGIGNVAVGWSGTDETREELELVSVEQLDASALADVNVAALELDARAYEVSPDVYNQTEPATFR